MKVRIAQNHRILSGHHISNKSFKTGHKNIKFRTHRRDMGKEFPLNAHKLIAGLENAQKAGGNHVLNIIQIGSFTSKICRQEHYPKTVLSKAIAQSRNCQTLACFQGAESATAWTGVGMFFLIILCFCCWPSCSFCNPRRWSFLRRDENENE